MISYDKLQALPADEFAVLVTSGTSAALQ